MIDEVEAEQSFYGLLLVAHTLNYLPTMTSSSFLFGWWSRQATRNKKK
jgi:hypothetical protein